MRVPKKDLGSDYNAMENEASCKSSADACSSRVTNGTQTAQNDYILTSGALLGVTCVYPAKQADAPKACSEIVAGLKLE